MKKDLARWRQDKMAILIWLGIPLMIGGLITSMMGGDGGPRPTGILFLVDEDESFISGVFSGAYSQGELGELISVEKVTAEGGTARINDGEGSGLLIIPKGFQAAFFDEEPITLVLHTNPSQTILPGIIEDVTEILLDAGFYAQQLFGEEIEQIQSATESDGPSDALVAAISIAIRQKIESAGEHLFPPAIDVEIVEPPAEEPGVPLALLFLPGIILMAVMFSAQGLSADYWVERRDGTLRRLVTAPGRLGSFLGGKALAAGVVIALIGGLTLVIGFIYHGIAWGKFPSSLLWIAVSGIGLFAWFGALQMLTTNRRAGNLITTMLVFPLLMAGGSFFPLAALPDWLAAIGRRTPNGFIADRLTDEITAASAWAIDLESWLGVIAIGLSGLLLCAWRLRSGFARS